MHIFIICQNIRKFEEIGHQKLFLNLSKDKHLVPALQGVPISPALTDGGRPASRRGPATTCNHLRVRRTVAADGVSGGAFIALFFLCHLLYFRS